MPQFQVRFRRKLGLTRYKKGRSLEKKMSKILYNIVEHCAGTTQALSKKENTSADRSKELGGISTIDVLQAGKDWSRSDCARVEKVHSSKDGGVRGQGANEFFPVLLQDGRNEQKKAYEESSYSR